MNFSDRISNQAAIYFSQGRYNRNWTSPDVRSPSPPKKGKESTKEWIARRFYSDHLPVTAPKRNSTPTTVPDRVKAADTNRTSYQGKPAIFFGQSLIDFQAEKFKFCLVGKFPGWRPSLSQIRNWVSSKWKLRGEWSITLLDHRHVFIRLDNEDDMLQVWSRNWWFIGGGHLMKVFKWFPTFVPSNGEEPPSAAVWVSLPSLPLAFFQKDLLFPIASLAGKVLAMDGPTRDLSRTDLARVCVEVDLLKEPPRQVWVGVGEGGFFQDLCYQRLPSYCSSCRQQGHSTDVCPAKRSSRHESRTEQSKTSMKNPNSDTGPGDNRSPKVGSQVNQFRICPIIEDEKESKRSIFVGSAGSSTMTVKGKEILECKAESPSVDSGGRAGVSHAAVVEQLFQTKNLDGRANEGTCISGECVCLGAENQGMKEFAEEMIEVPDSPQSEDFNPLRSKRLYSESRILSWKDNQKEAVPKYMRPPPPRPYKYSEIKEMTKSFRDVAGEGMFGVVYKGKLPDGQQVALKVFKRDSDVSNDDFINEMQIGSAICHGNIIRLLGFCCEGSNRVLVYDFMPNGCLQHVIYNKESRAARSGLLQMAIEIARGLEYLHCSCDPPILHLDLKPSNILMDTELCPKICDFGCAQRWVYPDSDFIVRGTYGYAAPEYIATGRASPSSDVYSYGILLLEMALRRRPFDVHARKSAERLLINWVRRKVTPMGRIPGIELEETERKMIIAAVWCAQDDPSRRPSLRNVVDLLKGSVDESGLISYKMSMMPLQRWNNILLGKWLKFGKEKRGGSKESKIIERKIISVM